MTGEPSSPDGSLKPRVHAALVRSPGGKIPDLSVALEVRFGEHHAMLCRLHLKHLDGLQEMIAELDAQDEKMMRPFQPATSS